MRLRFEQRLPASPAAVWPFLTDPERMNRWSEARVRLLAAGDGGVDGVGASRRVTIRSLAGQIELDEVIERSEPGARLVYRVVRGAPVRYHRGEITLTSQGAETLLSWDVDVQFSLPGMGLLVRRMLEPQLQRSLDVLAETVRGAQPARHAPPRDVEDRDAIPALRAEAEAILEEQRAHADRLEARNDPKRWFARVYAFVTENQLRLSDGGGVPHPAWVLRLIPRFHHYYMDNFRRYAGQVAGGPEAHWQSAFQSMDAADAHASKIVGISVGLAKGVRAHIEEDLPRTLAEIYVWHYAGRCDYARFRADYLSMRDVFRDASDRLIAQIPPSYLPIWMRVARPIMSVEMREDLVRRRFYDVQKRRREAFERGERLARLLLAERERASV